MERQGRDPAWLKTAHGHAHLTASHMPLSAHPDFVELSTLKLQSWDNIPLKLHILF